MTKNNLKKEIEIELLAYLIEDQNNFPIIFQRVSLDMISNDNRKLFQSLYNLKQKESDKILWEIKKHSQDLAKGVLNKSVLPSNIDFTIKKFFDLFYAVQMDELAQNHLKMNQDSFNGLDQISTLSESLESLQKKLICFEENKTFSDSYPNILKRLEDKKKNRNTLRALTYPSFTSATGGLNTGNLVTIAGALKNGKTSFAINLILDFASQNYTCAIFSLEMSEAEIQDKILGIKSGIDHNNIRNPKKLSEQESEIIKTYKKNEKEKLFIIDNVFSMMEVESTCKLLKQKNDLKFVMLDYIGLLKPSFRQSYESREREIAGFSNSLKRMAKELDLVVIALSQLNRTGMNDPSSINLAESLGLARDSDFLFTIYNAKDYRVASVNSIPVKENDFILKLDASRHSQKGGKLLLRMDSSGLMKEVTSLYDNTYM